MRMPKALIQSGSWAEADAVRLHIGHEYFFKPSWGGIRSVRLHFHLWYCNRTYSRSRHPSSRGITCAHSRTTSRIAAPTWKQSGCHDSIQAAKVHIIFWVHSLCSNLMRHPRQPHDLHAGDVSGVGALVRKLVETPVHRGKSTPLYHRSIGILRKKIGKLISVEENICEKIFIYSEYIMYLHVVIYHKHRLELIISVPWKDWS